MSEWKEVFESSRAVPPHSQRVNLVQELSLGFRIVLKYFVGGAPPAQGLHLEFQEALYQLRVTLFDISHRHYFGRTWKGSLQKIRADRGQPNTVLFNEVLYFHTSLRHPNVVAVVEVVAVVPKADGSQHAVGCGFGILHLFFRKTDPEEPPAFQEEKRLTLYLGTPRALLLPTLHDPIEQDTLLTPIEGSYLLYSLHSHPALGPVLRFLPQNILVSGTEDVPGVIPSSEDTVDSLWKPRLLKSHTCYLDKLSVTLYPSLEKFEEQLLELIHTDHMNKKNCGLDGDSVVIQERRLHVGVHNGWGFVERPQIVIVEPEENGGDHSSSFRRGSFSRLSSSPNSSTVLALHNRLHLKGMVNHSAFGIVFQLEYVFSAPVGGDGKLPSTTSSFSRISFKECLRWGVWCPFQESDGRMRSNVCLALRGGVLPSPAGVLVYAAASDGSHSTKVKDEPQTNSPDQGTLKFQFSTRSEGQPSSPTVPNRPEERSRQKKSHGQSNSMLQTPTMSPRGPGLSISQLTAIPCFPTNSHSAASPWQQQFPSQLCPHIELPSAHSIAHLEANLSQHSVQVPSPGVEQLQELAFTPVHAPVIALGTQASCSASLMSRDAMAHLYSLGVPEILDCSNQVAEVLDPTEPVNFNPQKEEADYLQCNKIILQFLAFSRVPHEGVHLDWPNSVYFTFQFYRFPPVKTQRLILLNRENSKNTDPCVLAPINKDGTVGSGCPGLQLVYLVDPGFLKPGEQRWFQNYLALHTLQIDVWDSDSLLFIGSAAVELQHTLRQGRSAVQVTQELEVVTTEYMQDAVTGSGAATAVPVNVFTTVKGKIHLRMGNVGLPVDPKLTKLNLLPPSRSHVVQAHGDTSSFRGGSVLPKSLLSLNASGASHARRLVDIDADLAALLHSRVKEPSAAPAHGQQEAEDVRLRKLERMAAVRQYEERGHIGPQPKHALMSRREARLQHSRDLHLIEAYREQSKANRITGMLSKAITTHHTIYASLGTAEFLEFVLKNPFNVQHTVTVESGDPELGVIVNCEEWRYFKELTKTYTPLEEDMFHLKQSTFTPQVYLRPRETVHIPLRYQTFTSSHDVVTQGPANAFSTRSAEFDHKSQLNKVQTKVIKVMFRAEDGKPIAILQLNVEPSPHVIYQTFRFCHPELTFLKKAIRLPPWENLPDRGRQIHVRCSDPNVICDTKRVAAGEPQDVFLKVAGGQSPQIKKFFITVFTDRWLAVPAQIWQVYIHFMHRVDVSCVAGQLSWQSLVLRGTQALRKVKCYTSNPGELQIDPAEVFVLPPNAVQDLKIGVRPRKAGCRFMYLNLVDVEYHQLVTSWLLCLSCQQPLISKAFEIFLPVGGGKGSNKKITYTNPYKTERTFLLSSDHPDLLQFKADSFQVGAEENYTIGLRFAPGKSAGFEDILVFINDLEDKTEETFCIKVQYQ